MKTYQEKIRAERKRQGLSYESLARIAGVSYRTIYLVEAGKVSPSVATLTKIAKGLNLTPGYFLS